MKKAFPTFISILILLFSSVSLVAQHFITIKVTQPPELSISELPDLIYTGDPVQLGSNDMVSGGSGDYIYHWEPEERLDNPSSPRPWATPLEDITYSLVVTDENNCNQLTTQSVSVDRTEILNVTLNPEVIVFPNPANNIIHISSFRNHLIPDIRCSVFTITGKRLLTKEYSVNAYKFDITLDLQQYEAGVYMLVVSSKDFLVKKRIILQ